jgi:protein CpxP
MKKIFLVCAFVLGVSAVSLAQGFQQRTPAEQVDQLKTQVAGITDAQAAKLKLVYEAAGKTRDSLVSAMQNGGGDMQAGMANFTKMRDKTNAQVKAVLTAEQQTAFQKVADAQAERMKQMMQGGGGN